MFFLSIIFFSKRYRTNWDFETSSDHKIVVIFCVGEFVCGRIHRKAFVEYEYPKAIIASKYSYTN